MLYNLFKLQIERNNRKGNFAANIEIVNKMSIMLSIGQLTEAQFMELYELAILQ